LKGHGFNRAANAANKIEGYGLQPEHHPIHMFLEINPRDEVALKSALPLVRIEIIRCNQQQKSWSFE